MSTVSRGSFSFSTLSGEIRADFNKSKLCNGIKTPPAASGLEAKRLFHRSGQGQTLPVTWTEEVRG